MDAALPTIFEDAERVPVLRRSSPQPASDSRLISDVDQLGLLFPSWDVSFNQLGEGRFQAEIRAVLLPEIHCGRFRLGRDCHGSGNSQGESGGILVLTHAPRDWRSRKLPLRAGCVYLWPPDWPLDLLAAAGSEGVVLTMGVKTFREVTRGIVGRLRAEILHDATILRPRHAALTAFESRLAELLPAEDSGPPAAAVGEDLQARCLDAIGRLLESSVPEPADPPRGERLEVVRAAEEYMDRHLHRPILSFEICEALCISRRTLFYAFRDVYGLSPMSYLKNKRLNMVRRELKRSDPGEVSIRAVAGRWAFGHSGQFAADYFRLFGERPSETLGSQPT